MLLHPRVVQRRRGCHPLGRILDHQLPDQVPTLPRPLSPPGPGRKLNAVATDGLAAAVHVPAVEGDQAAQELVHGRADPPHVGRVAEGLVGDDFRGHVVNSPCDLVDYVRPPRIKHRRQPEINDLRHACVPVRGCEHDILRLHVAMDHAHAVTVVGGHQRVSDDLGDEGLGQGFVGLFYEHLAVPSGEALEDEDQKLPLPVVAVLVEPDDVAVV
mmetsp:Transcript_56946/g.152061  ORF Transcript_56946/g.152061 Transcript_56946/m.152061 type:complete len:214 (-) Transcript_56946:432-1073(-)